MGDTEVRHELDEERRERIWEAVERTDMNVSRICDTLYGNGKEGLVTRVAKHEQAIGVLRFIGGSLIVAIIGVWLKG